MDAEYFIHENLEVTNKVRYKFSFFLAQDIVYVVLSEVWNEDDDKQGGQIEDYGQIRKVC